MPTTRIDLKDVGDMWMVQQSLDLPKHGIGGKKLKVTFHVLRTERDDAGKYDMLLRLRPWKDGGVKGDAVDA